MASKCCIPHKQMSDSGHNNMHLSYNDFLKALVFPGYIDDCIKSEDNMSTCSENKNC